MEKSGVLIPGFFIMIFLLAWVLHSEAHAAAPEIVVHGNIKLIIDGSTTTSIINYTDFGSTPVGGSSLERNFVISNAGTANLNLIGEPKINISGVHATDFTVSKLPDSPVTPGGSTNFRVTLNPAGAGVRTATISIANDDSDENPYDFVIQGTGLAPEIAVQGKGTVIVNGDTTPSASDDTDFGSIEIAGGYVERTFTIVNSGNVNLNLSGASRVSIAGADASAFTITTPPAATVAAGGSTTFTVSFDPSSAGLKTAILSIANDDNDRNPYTFVIQGRGTAPEIAIQGYGVYIADGDTTPATADGTDFGIIQVGESIRVTFTIINSGSKDLNLTGLPKVNIAGVNAADFTIDIQPASPIAPGGAANFEVIFAPDAVGVRTAELSIANDDSSKNPYNFSLQGEGVILAPELTGFTWARGTNAGTRATAVPAGTIKYAIGTAGALTRPYVGATATDYPNTLTAAADIPAAPGQHIFIIQVGNSSEVLAWTDVTVDADNIYVAAPMATSYSATGITTTTATLNGTVNANNTTTTVTFEYGKSTLYGSEVIAEPSLVSGTTDTAVSKTLTSLTPNTTYHYRVKAVNSGGISTGTDQTFTTADRSNDRGNRSGGSSYQPVNSTNGWALIPPGLGGTVALGSDVVISIPAAALKSSPTAVKVEIAKVNQSPTTPLGSMFLGAVYQFSVDGSPHYQFHEPVNITLTFDPSKLAPDAVPLVYYYDESLGDWVSQGGRVNNNIITITVDHFSQFTVLAKQAEVSESPLIKILPAEKPVFNDIANHWGRDAIKELALRQVISGYGDDSFQPDRTISRAEFTSLLVKGFKMNTSSRPMFTDINSHWAQDNIIVAAASGVVHGYTTEKFRPDEPITREQMAVMICRAVQVIPESEELSFDDQKNISAWAKNQVGVAVKEGIINGYPNNTFQPQGKATRAEAVTIVLKALRLSLWLDKAPDDV